MASFRPRQDHIFDHLAVRSGITVPQIDTSTAPPGPAGATAYDPVLKQLVYSNGHQWLPAGSGVVTAANVGTGAGVFKDQVSSQLRFRRVTNQSARTAVFENANTVGV